MKRLGLCVVYLLCICTVFAQSDTIKIKSAVEDSLKKVAASAQEKKADSVRNLYSPRKAAIRSAILPGWGQVYNKKYWKVPIVYGALGVTGGIFISNLSWYKRTRYAYKVLYLKDTANYDNVYYRLIPLVQQNQLNGLRNARDEYRRYVDYSVLFFLLFWGLNVVDATVDAHLKSFDVSPDLSMKIKPGYSGMAGTNGISLVFTFK